MDFEEAPDQSAIVTAEVAVVYNLLAIIVVAIITATYLLPRVLNLVTLLLRLGMRVTRWALWTTVSACVATPCCCTRCRPANQRKKRG
jgi:hypothetical protein